jgi:hypothetical protein
MSDLKEQRNCVNVFRNYNNYNNNNKFPRVTLQNFRDVSTNKFKLQNSASENNYSFKAVFVGSAMMRTQNFEWLLQFWNAEISFDDSEFSGRSFTIHTEETWRKFTKSSRKANKVLFSEISGMTGPWAWICGGAPHSLCYVCSATSSSRFRFSPINMTSARHTDWLGLVICKK